MVPLCHCLSALLNCTLVHVPFERNVHAEPKQNMTPHSQVLVNKSLQDSYYKTIKTKQRSTASCHRKHEMDMNGKLPEADCYDNFLIPCLIRSCQWAVRLCTCIMYVQHHSSKVQTNCTTNIHEL